MDIRVTIQRNQIHHWVNADLTETLEFGIRCPDYPELPTYGMRVNFPITKQILIDAIRAKLVLVKAQLLRDINIRATFDSWEISDFIITDV